MTTLTANGMLGAATSVAANPAAPVTIQDLLAQLNAQNSALYTAYVNAMNQGNMPLAQAINQQRYELGYQIRAVQDIINNAGQLDIYTYITAKISALTNQRNNVQATLNGTPLNNIAMRLQLQNQINEFNAQITGWSKVKTYFRPGGRVLVTQTHQQGTVNTGDGSYGNGLHTGSRFTKYGLRLFKQ